MKGQQDSRIDDAAAPYILADGRPPPRPVRIQRATHALGDDGICSCCHGSCSEGVIAHTDRRERFDPANTPHVFICLGCASAFGREAAREAPRRG